MSDRRVLKWTVPVDGDWHPVGGGRVVLVACQGGASRVQVWTEEGHFHDPTYLALVVGTGQPVPERAEHVGSTLTAGGALVWHVYRDVRDELHS